MACPLGFGAERAMYDDGASADDPYGEKAGSGPKKPLVPPRVTSLFFLGPL